MLTEARKDVNYWQWRRRPVGSEEEASSPEKGERVGLGGRKGGWECPWEGGKEKSGQKATGVGGGEVLVERENHKPWRLATQQLARESAQAILRDGERRTQPPRERMPAEMDSTCEGGTWGWGVGMG